MSGYPIAKSVQSSGFSEDNASLANRTESDQPFEQARERKIGTDQQRPTCGKIKNQEQSTSFLVLGCKIRCKNKKGDERGLKISLHDGFANSSPSAFDEKRSVILKCTESRNDETRSRNQSVIPRQINQRIFPFFPTIQAYPKPRKNEHKQK